MKGQIIEINSELHYVKKDNQLYQCKCRGIIRHEHITPVVGDYVLFDSEKLTVDKVLERKNIFNRPKVSNIDQSFIITSMVIPNFSSNLLDKFISLMEIKNVEPIIIITKMDLVKEKQKQHYLEIFNYYQKIGYKLLYNTEIEEIKKLIKDKISVFAGQTGAGKTTLINKINPAFNLKTNEVSKSLGRGKHTTRVVSMYEIFEGKVIDTPGFSALDFNDLTKEEIKKSFKEFNKYNCEYKDCLHKNEKNCGVKTALEDNNILKSRYENYLKFIGEEK